MILFGIIAFSTKEAILNMNPFYGRSEIDIKKNKKYAKEIYSKVFWSHLNFVYNAYGDFRGFIKDRRMENLII